MNNKKNDPIVLRSINTKPKKNWKGQWKKDRLYPLYSVVRNNGTVFMSLTGKMKDEPYVIYDPENETFSANEGWEIVEMSADSRQTAIGGTGTQGEPGKDGEDGKDAGFGTITASADSNTGNPSVDVSTSGPNTAKNISFAFHGLKGERGLQGAPGVSNADIKVVTTLPTASAETAGRIFLVETATAGTYARWYTEVDGSNYTWRQLGTTDVALEDYATKDNLSQLRQETTEIKSSVYGGNSVLMPNWARPGYYLSTTGEVTASSTWSISEPFILKQGRTISVKTQGSGACVIAQTNDGNTYTPLVNIPSGTTGLNTFTYTAEQDIKVAVSAKVGLNDVEISVNDAGLVPTVSRLDNVVSHDVNKKNIKLLSSDQFASIWQNKIDHILSFSLIGSSDHYEYGDVVIISNIGITGGKLYFWVLNTSKNYTLQYLLNEGDIPQDGIVNMHYETNGSVLDAVLDTNGFGPYIAGASNTIQVPFVVDYGYSNSQKIAQNTSAISSLQGSVSGLSGKLIEKAAQIFVVEDGTYKTIWEQHLKAVKSFNLQLSDGKHAIGDKIIVNVMGVNSNIFRFWLYDATNDRQFFSYQLDVTTPPAEIVIAEKTEEYVIKVILDYSKLGTYINTFDGNLVVPFTLFQDDSNADIKPNLVEVENIAFRKRWDWQTNSYIDDTSAASDRICSGLFPVTGGKIYKSNRFIEFTQYMDANKVTIAGGVSNPDKTMFFDVAPSGAAYASFGTYTARGKGYPEKWVIQEVASADDVVDENVVGIHAGGIKKDEYERMLANGYEEGIFNFGDCTDVVSGSVALDADGKILAVAMQNDYEGIVKSIDIDVVCSSSFDLLVGLGTIDQRPISLPRKFISVSVSNGKNHIVIPEEAVIRQVGPGEKGMFEPSLVMQKGEVVMIKADANSIGANASISLCGAGFHYEHDSNLEYILTTGQSLALGVKIVGKKYLPVPVLAQKTELATTNKIVSNVQSELNIMDIKNIPFTSPDGSYFKLAVSNEGTLSVNRINPTGKILIFGNSYDIHDYVPNVWWDDMGMAASRKENDWKHRVIRKLLVENNILLDFGKASAYFWERYNSYTEAQRYAPLDGITPGEYDLVIVRCGENTPAGVMTDEEWVDATKEMLDTIISKVGANVPIIFGGALKYRTQVNVPMQEAAQNYANVTWVDMTPLGNLQPFECGLDYDVLGIDGVWHKVSESESAAGVAIHPGDNVQAAMAETLYPYILNVFN